jgi:hypothetical protein
VSRLLTSDVTYTPEEMKWIRIQDIVFKTIIFIIVALLVWYIAVPVLV